MQIAHELARVAQQLPNAHAVAKLSLTQLGRADPRSTLTQPLADAIWQGLATTFRPASALPLLAGVTIVVFGRRFGYARARRKRDRYEAAMPRPGE